MKTQIIGSVKLEGGRLLTAANMRNITARKLTPTDRWGNRLGKNAAGQPTDHQGRVCEPYFQVWKIELTAGIPNVMDAGYHWVEVSHGGGICGSAKTVRELVIKTLFGWSNDIVVEVEA